MTCHDCPLDRGMRAEWGCGYLPESERTDTFPAPPAWEIEPTVCPGYSTGLPEVNEVARANFWAEKGYLRERFEGAKPTPQLMDALEIYATESARVQEYDIRKRQDRKG